jgi:hypothetical protein
MVALFTLLDKKVWRHARKRVFCIKDLKLGTATIKVRWFAIALILLFGYQLETCSKTCHINHIKEWLSNPEYLRQRNCFFNAIALALSWLHYCFPTVLFGYCQKISVPAPMSKILPLLGCCELNQLNLFFKAIPFIKWYAFSNNDRFICENVIFTFIILTSFLN